MLVDERFLWKGVDDGRRGSFEDGKTGVGTGDFSRKEGEGVEEGDMFGEGREEVELDRIGRRRRARSALQGRPSLVRKEGPGEKTLTLSVVVRSEKRWDAFDCEG